MHDCVPDPCRCGWHWSTPLVDTVWISIECALLPDLVARTVMGVGRNSSVAPLPSVTLVSDALDLGWGAHLGNLSTEGLWSQEDRSLHINIREVRAIHLACQVFLTYQRADWCRS